MTGSDGRSAGDQAGGYGDQVSPGGIPPSFGNAWQCWRINRELGLLDVTKYCTASGHGTSKLVASNAYGWQCTSPAAAVDTTAACNLQYHVSDAVSRFAVFASPYSWGC